ncbi:iron-sulfur cluster biosynthesis family protein [Paenibacillus sp. PL2-23]|uniref:iron-sulfur cluster biosynthesis family protein n=1 Tax=Paenibacillus sp. PL2-23 TaxID=2100729 RepID=UPI0030F69E0D
MHITFSEAAVRKLAPLLADGSRQLKLLHDTEGCGCVMSGVPALQLVAEAGVDDKMAEGDPFPFLYEPRHEVFYEPRLKIDYRESSGAFSLKSDNQTYTTLMRLHP